jgi:hypothetical protein
MSESTSIHDLPANPAGGGGASSNISFNATEMQPANAGPSNTGFTLDQNTISQIVSGIQQASTTGATMLPSRDIPMSTENLVHDPQTQANYIPPPQNKDYIKDFETPSEIIDNYNRSVKQTDILDDMYEEIQIPLLIAILFFLFQLPIFKKKLFTFLPFLFFNDGNYNVQGYVFMSVLFGICYYFISKTMGHFNKF